MNAQRKKILWFYLRSLPGFISELVLSTVVSGREKNDQHEGGWQLLRTAQLSGSCKAAFEFMVIFLNMFWCNIWKVSVTNSEDKLCQGYITNLVCCCCFVCVCECECSQEVFFIFFV